MAYLHSTNRLLRSGALIGGALLLGVSACSTDPDVSGGTTGGGGGATGTPGAGGITGGFNTAGSSGTGGGGTTGAGGGPSATGVNCGLEKFDLKRVPAELLVVLDRSGSMLDDAMNGKVPLPQSKWAQMTNALNQAISTTQASVYWGLKTFPTGMTCGVSATIDVEPALNNAGPIMTFIAGATAMNGAGTPTTVAVTQAAALMQPRPSTNKYLLLATDGLPTCKGGGGGTADAPAAIKAVADAAAVGLPTFVVGIATTKGNANMTLNEMAKVGGKPRNDPTTQYYAVENKDELVAVLGTITGQIASCTFPTKTPPNPNDVAVDVSIVGNAKATRIPKDTTHANGWDYGPAMKSVQVYGPLCEQLKAGTASNVQIIFGCPGKVIP